MPSDDTETAIAIAMVVTAIENVATKASSSDMAHQRASASRSSSSFGRQ